LNKANNTAGEPNEKNSVTAGVGLQKNNEAPLRQQSNSYVPSTVPAGTSTLTNSDTEGSTVLGTVPNGATPEGSTVLGTVPNGATEGTTVLGTVTNSATEKTLM